MSGKKKVKAVLDFQKAIEFAVGNQETSSVDENPRDFSQANVARLSSRVTSTHRGMLSRIIKRAMDIAIAALALVFLFPGIVVIGAAILICDGRPIVFQHKRIGRNGREFKCLKFRSMARDADVRLRQLLDTNPEIRAEWEQNHKLVEDPRVHGIGHLLRRSSLDELPQLINIIKGEMSVVGPRPIVADEIPRFGQNFSDYKRVRPGLTGLWQVSGRSDKTYTERVALDTAYVNNRSTTGDIVIILKTAAVVWNGSGSH